MKLQLHLGEKIMIKNWHISGDTHGSLSRFDVLDAYEPETAAIIILGDVSFNYTNGAQDFYLKKKANTHQNYIYCVRGNHEMRPEDVSTMEEIWDENVCNSIYYEPAFPYIRYFKDGNLYLIDGFTTLVIGGAYSVDKHYRIAMNRRWFPNEQLTAEEMEKFYTIHKNTKVDFILSHTCPLSWQPTDLFLEGLDQSTVDNSMEIWMDKLKDSLDWNIWLFGHYHRERLVRPHVEMLFTEIQKIKDIYERWNNPNIKLSSHWAVDPKFKNLDNKWIKEEENKWNKQLF